MFCKLLEMGMGCFFFLTDCSYLQVIPQKDESWQNQGPVNNLALKITVVFSVCGSVTKTASHVSDLP